jgi:hypothetical protein
MTGTVGVMRFLEQLNRARAEGRAVVEIDFRHVTHMNCPLGFEALKGRIAYIYLGLMVAVGVGMRWGLAAPWSTVGIAALVVSAVYWVVGKRFLEKRAERKIIRQLTSDGVSWEKLWRYGGVTLRIRKDGDEMTWVAPKASWIEAYEHL